MPYCCVPLAVPGLHASGRLNATTPIQLRQRMGESGGQRCRLARCMGATGAPCTACAAAAALTR